ncbi:hypothetical protein ACTXT7_009686 [Hymenolepis weldensis]
MLQVPEGRNIALADSASVAQDDTLHIPSPKPVLTDFGMSVNPRSSRFIGLLVAYILITLLVVYMVVCTVCFQPRKCLNLVSRGTNSEKIDSNHLPTSQTSNTTPPGFPRSIGARRFQWNWFRSRNFTNQNTDVPLVLPRSNPHFSRSVNGERFLHYSINFLPETADNNMEDEANWALHRLCHHQHHHELSQQHQRPLIVNSPWDPRVNEPCYSPLPTIGIPLMRYDQ